MTAVLLDALHPSQPDAALGAVLTDWRRVFIDARGACPDCEALYGNRHAPACRYWPDERIVGTEAP